MTYDQIVEWVSENFDVTHYKTYIDFENAVKERFAQDGVTFPKGAEAHMQDAFAYYFEQPKELVIGNTLNEYFSPVQDTPSKNLEQNMFQFVGVDLGESSVKPLSEISQSKQTRVIGSLRTIGQTFKRVFERFFRR